MIRRQLCNKKHKTMLKKQNNRAKRDSNAYLPYLTSIVFRFFPTFQKIHSPFKKLPLKHVVAKFNGQFHVGLAGSVIVSQMH